MTQAAPISSIQASLRIARLAPWCFGLVAGVGALAWLGWQFESDPFSQRWLLTKPSSALGFVLLGFALSLRLGPRGGWRSAVITACVLGIELLAVHRWLGLELDAALAAPGAAPGHIAPAASIDLLLMGLVTWWLDERPRATRFALSLTLLALFFALGTLAGHGYGVRPEHAFGLQPMVPLTALLFTLTCVGVFAARMPPDIAGLIASPSPSARAVRELLLGVISIPIVLGFVERWFFHRGLHDTEFGVAVLMVANMLLVFVLTMRSVRSLLAAQRERARLEHEVEQTRIHAQTQQALQRSEEKYRALAVNAPVGIFEATLDGRCTFVNEAWSDITGYTQEEVLDRGWNKVTHPEDFAHVVSEWRLAVLKDSASSLDFRYCTKAGQVAWVQGSLVPLKDEDGRVSGVMGTVVDMTERRRTLEALEKSELNFRSLVERAPFGVLVTRDLKMVYANAAYLGMVGHSDGSEIIGRSFLELLPEEFHEVALQRMEQRRSGIELPSMPARIKRKDGSLISLEGDTVMMVFDGAPSTVSVVRDVTERERAEQVRLLAEQTMRDSLREKDVLLKEIHHRVKNNLQVIVSLINLQASKLADGMTRTVFEETRSRVHAIALLHERLYTSKNIGHIDMRGYLDGLASDLSSSNVSIRPIDLQVRSDELYLEMDKAVPAGLIVNELVTNAYKHAFPERLGRSGQIEIVLERVGSDVQIIVRDDGIGYPGDLDPDTSDSLGLLLISSLSRQLDADLRFEQESPGARCVVRFPYSEEQDEMARAV